MTTIRRSVVVSAPPEAVWGTVEDIKSYVSKFEPHTLSFETLPQGPLSVGQKVHAIVAGGRRGTVEVFSQITEVIPGKKVVETLSPTDYFRKMVETVTLEPIPEGTRVSIVVEYESRGLRAGILAWLFARRAIERNFAVTLSNLRSAFEAA